MTDDKASVLASYLLAEDKCQTMLGANPARWHSAVMGRIIQFANKSLFAVLLLGGCAHYLPRPIEPRAILATPPAYDFVAVNAEAARLAPGAVTGQINSLTLFAAALLYNPDIAAARSAIATAQANAAASRIAAGTTFTLSTEYANDPAARSNWLLGAGVDVPLDIGGRRAARLTSAALTVEIARYDYAETVWATRMNIRRALAARLIAERQAALFETTLALRERHFAAMQRRVNAGEASRAELERVRADLADTSRRLGEARAQMLSNLATLSALTGIPQATLSDGPVEWMYFDGPEAAPLINGDVRSDTLVGRADVLKVVAAYDMAEADLRGEVAKQYPAITLSPGFTWERGLVKLPFNIGLALPPFDLNRHAIAAAEAKRREAGQRLEAVLAGASSALDIAEIEVVASRQALVQVRGGELTTAQRLARIADNEIRFGAIDRTEWAAAQSGIALARLSELDALARVQAADAALEDVARRPLFGPERAIQRVGMQP